MPAPQVLKSVQIRPITDDLLPLVAELWSLSFEARSREYWVEWIKEEGVELYGAFDSGHLYAVVGMHAFETMVAGKWVPCGGVEGVASDPSHRGSGLVQKVMTHCLETLRGKQIALAILGTGIHSFYERMGFATTDWHYRMEVSTRSLAMFRKVGDSRNFKMISSQDYALCIPIHDRWLAQSTLSIRRSQARWRRQALGENSIQFFVHKDGYMAIDLTATQAQNKVVVKDWAHLTEQAYFDGLALLAQMGSQYESATWVDPDPERLLKQGMLEQPAKVSLLPGQMSRAVDVEAFGKSIRRNLDAVKLRDPLGVSGKNVAGGIGPGELVQLVTGFWRDTPEDWPQELYGVIAKPRAYTCERF